MLSKFWWKNNVARVMIMEKNSHIFPRAWAEGGGTQLGSSPDPSMASAAPEIQSTAPYSRGQKLSLEFQAGISPFQGNNEHFPRAAV